MEGWSLKKSFPLLSPEESELALPSASRHRVIGVVVKGSPFQSQEWRWGDDGDCWKNICPLLVRKEKSMFQAHSCHSQAASGWEVLEVYRGCSPKRAPPGARGARARDSGRSQTVGAGFLPSGFARHKAPAFGVMETPEILTSKERKSRK